MIADRLRAKEKLGICVGELRMVIDDLLDPPPRGLAGSLRDIDLVAWQLQRELEALECEAEAKYLEAGEEAAK